MQTRCCSRCKSDKPLSEFWKTYSYCKPCSVERNRQWVEANRDRARELWRRRDPARNREKRREWGYALRTEILNAYGHRCELCGETTREFLALDHRNGGGGVERRRGHGFQGFSFYKKVRDEGFPDRYRLLCHNCNQRRVKVFAETAHGRWAAKLWRQLLDAYGSSCGCCGFSDVTCLAVDHVNGGGLAERKAGLHKGGSGLYCRIRREGFPPTYRLLCHNCNSARAFFDGCPHKQDQRGVA